MYLIVAALGILAIAAGIVTLAFGIPINEFNLGNALIVAGTTLIAAGLILVGLAAAVHQLGQVALALRPRVPGRPVTQPQAAEQAAAVRPMQAPAQPSPNQVPAPGPVRPPVPPRAPVFAKPKAEEHAGQMAPAESEPEAPFSAIERLRSSLPRPDRRPSEEVEDAPDTAYAQSFPAPAAPPGAGREANRGINPGTNGAAPAVTAEATKKPGFDFLFRSKTRESQPEAFDSVWPRRGQRRPDDMTEVDQSASPAAAEAPIERPAPAPPYAASAPHGAPAPHGASEPDDVRPAAILKSGVVDGMAYTLYADGSIEAQLPQGTVRFGSIAELRAHIENNS
jgi:hypothetical protein